MTDKQASMSDSDLRNFLHKRLDSIEAKLSELQSVMITLARVEERLSNNLDGMIRLGRRVDEHEERIAQIEHQVISNSRVSRAVERIGWMIVTLAFSIMGFMAKELAGDGIKRQPKAASYQSQPIIKPEDISANKLTGEES
jgi:hypothetical protein